MRLLTLSLLVFTITCAGCGKKSGGGGGGDDGGGEDDGGTDTDPETGNNPSDPFPTGTLAITGSLANADTPANTDVLKSKEVELFRNDGTLIGKAETDAAGAFNMELTPGSLAVQGEGYGLQDPVTDEDTADFRFYLQATVPDDGTGKALGIKRKIKLTQSAATTTEADKAVFDTGVNALKEVSAITGKVTFADANTTSTATDVYIPGKSFFARTGDDGEFQLLFVPAGSYTIRVQKGVYIKEVDVTVEAGKTTKLGTQTVALTDRNPQPLSKVIIGKWNTACYYSDAAGGVSPEAPLTGVLNIKKLNDVALVSGESCLLRTTLAAPGVFVSLSVPSDGSIITQFASDTFYLHLVTGYTNDSITAVYNSYVLGGNAVEVFTRAD